MLIVLLLAALQAAPAPNDAQRLYVVGANDVLTITVYNQAQLSGKFVVEADGTFAYPVREEIPVMLIDEAIPLRDGLSPLRYVPPAA